MQSQNNSDTQFGNLNKLVYYAIACIGISCSEQYNSKSLNDMWDTDGFFNRDNEEKITNTIMKVFFFHKHLVKLVMKGYRNNIILIVLCSFREIIKKQLKSYRCILLKF